MVAVNPGSLASHQKWAEKNGFDFPICVDAEKMVAKAYGSLKLGGLIQRSVILVDPDGKVAWVKEGLPSTEEILAAVDAAKS